MTQLADRPAGHEETLTAAVQNVALGAQSLTMVQALNRALRDAMAADDRVLVFGEDVAVEGGVFRVTEGLAAAFGENRCFDTPLAESAIIGIAVGLALRGFVPVPEIQFDGFSYPAFDQVVSHLAKYRTRTRGERGNRARSDETAEMTGNEGEIDASALPPSFSAANESAPEAEPERATRKLPPRRRRKPEGDAGEADDNLTAVG